MSAEYQKNDGVGKIREWLVEHCSGGEASADVRAFDALVEEMSGRTAQQIAEALRIQYPVIAPDDTAG